LKTYLPESASLPMSATRFRAAFFAAVVLVLAGSGFSPAQAPEPPDAQIAEGAKRIAENVTEAERQRLAAVEAVAPLVRPSLSAPSPVATDGDGGDAGAVREEPFPTPAPFDTEDLVEIAGPTEAKVGSYFLVSIKAPKAEPGRVASQSLAKPPEGAPPAVELLGKNGEAVYLFQQVIKGEYLFRAAAQVKNPETFDAHDEDTLVVVVGGKPDPDPIDPDPIDPDPVVDPDAKGPIFGVVLYDAEGDDSLTAAQRNSLNSEEVHAYLQAKGLKVGGNVQWRQWDDNRLTDADLSEESEPLRKAYAEAKAKFNGKAYVVLSNGKAGFSGPLPETHEAILALLKKYGG
jgi:hypothetical protein